MKPRYCSLHAHSAEGSLFDGVPSVKDYVDRCAKYGYNKACLTEHGTLLSAVTLAQECKKKGIPPVQGIESYYCLGDHRQRPAPNEKLPFPTCHLTLLAETEEGWKNLSSITTTGHLEGQFGRRPRPRVGPDVLRRHSKGVICLTGCVQGPLSYFVRNDQPRLAIQQLEFLLSTFGKDNVYLEVQPHNASDNVKCNEFLKQVHRDYKLPYVLTLDSHYLDAEDSLAHEVRVCISTGRTLADPNRLQQPYGEFRVRTIDELTALPMVSEYADCLENSAIIADRCTYVPELGHVRMPKFPVPEGYTPESYFDHKVKEGFREKLPLIEAAAKAKGNTVKDYEDRVAYESDTIKKLGFAEYLLVVGDIQQHAREASIPTGAGRGSVCNSLCAYLLQIHDVDPMYFGLIFERFINPERTKGGGLPDIDLDFSHARHHEIIEYVKQKYGDDHVGNICTFQRIQGRGSIQDVGRVLGIDPDERIAISSHIPKTQREKHGLKETLANSKEFSAAVAKHPKLKELCLALEGLPRHTGIHPGGVVITPEPLASIAPMFTADDEEQGKKRVVAVQMDKYQAEAFGLVKFDFLRVTDLDTMSLALASIKKHEGKTVVLRELPMDDPKVMEMFQKADTDGIFQMGTPRMKSLLKPFKPETVEHLAVINALARPGAESGADQVLKIRKGQRPVYLFPELEPVLKRTYAFPIYQESLMQTSQIVAGFTVTQAEALRKACASKNAEAMSKISAQFLEGALKLGRPKEKIDIMLRILKDAGSYGFGAGHSSAYALWAYWAGYIKTYYPVHFLAAGMSVEAANEERLDMFINMARRQGIELLPPDINKSELDFVVEGGKIRFGLTMIDGLGDAGLRVIERIRKGVDQKELWGYYFTERPLLQKAADVIVDLCDEPDEIEMLLLAKMARAAAGDSQLYLRFPLDGHRVLIKSQLRVDRNSIGRVVLDLLGSGARILDAEKLPELTASRV